MDKENFVVSKNERPEWVEYPDSYCRLVEQGLIHLTPWHILEEQRAAVHFRGLAQRYPKRELFPFAYRQDNDDVACWERGMEEMVFVIHDFASPGWENVKEFDNVWSWFRSAVEETILWE